MSYLRFFLWGRHSGMARLGDSGLGVSREAAVKMSHGAAWSEGSTGAGGSTSKMAHHMAVDGRPLLLPGWTPPQLDPSTGCWSILTTWWQLPAEPVVQERVRERLTCLYDLVSTVTRHHFCFTPFVSSGSLSPAHTQREGVQAPSPE